MLRHMIFLLAGHRQEQLMKKQELSNLKGILFIAFFFSLFIMLLGMRQYSQKRLFILSFSFFFAAGILFDLSAARLSPRMRRFLSGEKLSEKINGSCSVRMRKRFLWLLITLSFVPAYLALFPGTFGYDAPVQAAQYFGEMELSGANPLLHTYLLFSLFRGKSSEKCFFRRCPVQPAAGTSCHPCTDKIFCISGKGPHSLQRYSRRASLDLM